MEENYDIIVLGSGPGGYTAAIRAAQSGFKVAIIEKENNLGGICANWGCIPTKSLLHSAEILDIFSTEHAEKLGLSCKSKEHSFKNAIIHSRDVASKMSSGVGMLMKKNKITVITGHCTMESKNSVSVKIDGSKNRIINSKNIIIATGAVAKNIPGINPGDNIWTYREALSAETIPKSITIIGSGAIGLEFASVYNSFGCKVNVMEAMDRILPLMDNDISNAVKKRMESLGIKFTTGIKIKSVKHGKSISLDFEVNGKEYNIESDVMLVAIGVSGNTESLGLEKVGIRCNKSGFIEVNNKYQTSVENIYAIGDVIGGLCLAHKASHEAISCVEIIEKKHHKPILKEMIPLCVYSNPQIASIGFTEEQVKEKGLTYEVGTFNYSSSGKAVAIGESNGFVKVISDKKTGEILGAHIVGYNATEIIHSCVVAKHLEGTYKDMQNIIFAHPTISELIPEAFLAIDKMAING